MSSLEKQLLAYQGDTSEEARATIQKLTTDLANAEKDLHKAKYSNVKPTDAVNDDNINLIKRINILEKFLWRNGFNPDNIK